MTWHYINTACKGAVLGRPSSTLVGDDIPVGTLRIPRGHEYRTWDFVDYKAVWNDAYSGCDRIEQVNLPFNIMFFGARAFKDCMSLRSFRDEMGRYFYGLKNYDEAAEFCKLKGICVSAFSGCSALDKGSLPGHIPAIGEDAFRDCRLVDYDDGRSRETTYYVGRLPEEVSNGSLAGLFRLVAKNVAIRNSRGDRNYTFVTIKGQSPEVVVDIMDGIEINGACIKVDVADFVDKDTFPSVSCDSRGHYYYTYGKPRTRYTYG